MPAHPNPDNSTRPDSKTEHPDASGPLDQVFANIVLPPSIELPDGADIAAIPLREENVKVRFRADTTLPAIDGEGILSGRLEIELSSPAGRAIDTIEITKLTETSLEKILAEVTEREAGTIFKGLAPLIGRPLLSQGKLRGILTTATSEGAHVNSRLGVSPGDIAAKYNTRLTRPRGEDEIREVLQQRQDSITTHSVLFHGFALARSLGISAVLVPANATSIVSEVQREREGQKVIWIVSDEQVDEIMTDRLHRNDLVHLSTNPDLGPASQQRLALFSALARGALEIDQPVMCFTGRENSPHLVGVDISVPGRVFSWITRESLEALRAIPDEAFEVIERVIDIALRFSLEGIEGKKMGAVFVVGEARDLEPHLDQHILSPFEGHQQKDLSVHKPLFLRTLRQFSSNDGAVIIQPNGIAVSASTHLVAPAGEIESREGWGARHVSAAAITSVTGAVAVVLSESSGDVTVMWDGRPILELSRT